MARQQDDDGIDLDAIPVRRGVRYFRAGSRCNEPLAREVLWIARSDIQQAALPKSEPSACFEVILPPEKPLTRSEAIEKRWREVGDPAHQHGGLEAFRKKAEEYFGDGKISISHATLGRELKHLRAGAVTARSPA